MNRCHFIPPYLLQNVASSDADVVTARCGHSTLAIDEQLRSRRQTPPPTPSPPSAPPTPSAPSAAAPAGSAASAASAVESGEDAWTVHTADNGSALPGAPVRSSGEPASGDAAVDEAYTGVEASLGLFRDELGRDSYDGRGSPVIATVHYENNYDNAFWDGRQLVFGDGDRRVFDRFTKPIDVLAHEFTHGVTQHTAGFTYQGQSGALNESVSDVFASCVKQRVLGQTAEEADWLIGEGIFMPSVNGRALRSMAEPGTAYDDPQLGKDPQVGSMDDYVDTGDDNGGVHVNSGIPNRAFYLAATALGGSSWQRAARIWYSALTSGIGPDTDFAAFAQATIEAARGVAAGAGGPEPQGSRPAGSDAAGSDAAASNAAGPDAEGSGVQGSDVEGSGVQDAADAVRRAWQTVGVGGSPGGPDVGRPAPSAERVVVRRTGGFAGISVSGEVDLAGAGGGNTGGDTGRDWDAAGDSGRDAAADPRAAEVRELLDRIDFRAVASTGQPQPDRFVYAFVVMGEEVVVPEQSLTPELSRLVSLVLDD